MRSGDLVRHAHGSDRIGIILTWVRTGGTETTLWEVIWPDSEIEILEEIDLELLSEYR